ncbi:MAG: MFS transporter [Rhodospirillales bacterium]|nr:MFS transporter [Rhodospirillales bacterium]
MLVRVFVPFAFAYFFSHLFRTVNAVLAPNLVGDLGLDAAVLGLLTSVYFLSFAAMQLPLGILLDRFGARRSESALLLFTAAGAMLFAIADSVPLLILARALIGLGVSAGLAAAFKAYRGWFPIPRLPLVNGCHMVFGSLGALAATAPVEMALGIAHWRTIFLVMGALTLAAAAILFFVVPEREGEPRSKGGLREQITGILQIFTSPIFWRVTPVVVSTQAAHIAVQTLWAGPWLKDVAGLDRADVSQYLLLITAGMIVGFPLQGAVAERLQRFGIPVTRVIPVGVVLFFAVQIPVVLGWTGALAFVWSAYGFLGCVTILAYADLPQHFPPALSGRVITGLNMLVFVMAFTFQWGIGLVVNQWTPTADGVYPVEAYQAAFGLVLAVEIASFLWYFLFRPARRPAQTPRV